MGKRSIAGAPLVGCLALCAIASPGRAQNNPFQGLAEHLAAPRPGSYQGPIVPWPEGPARPAPGELRARSLRSPLVVLAGASAGEAQVLSVLDALERAYDWLAAHGFPLPYPRALEDGAGIEVYLLPELVAGAGAGIANPIGWSGLDAGETFALLDEHLEPEELDRCALAALAHAGLLGADPAEPPGVLAAGAAAAALQAHGELGCRFDPERMQDASALGPLGATKAQVDDAALWLALELARHDPGQRGLLPGLFESARQKSDDANALHARPTAWSALDAVLRRARESLDEAAIERAASRWLLPFGDGAAYGVPTGARVTPRLESTLDKLPERVSPEAPLGTYGSAYAVINVGGAREGDQLRVWLRADVGPRWSLLALVLRDDGRELSRMAAPPRTTPESFLPLELEPLAARVVLIVTRLPHGRVLDAVDALDDDAPSFELTIDTAHK